MKRILVFLMVLAMLCSFSFKSFSEDLKVGYVDIFQIFNDYAKTKAYDKTLEGKKKAAEKELEAKKTDLEKMQKRLSVLKEGEKEKIQTKITKAVGEYRELERKAFTDIKKARDEKMKEIIEDINKVIDAYAKKHKYNLIVNENAVLYGDKVMDITKDILKIANKEYKSKK